MAADGLIEQYIDAFARRIRTRRDRADLIDEIADHLHSAADRLVALGESRETAERRALARFGDPTLVASLISAVPSKGNIVSLFFSRHLGALSAVAAILWVAATVTSLYGFTDFDGGWTSSRYLVSAAVLAAACLVTTAVLVGLNLRATGQFDGQTIAIAVIGAAASAAALALAWAVIVWLPLLSIAVTWTLARAWRAHAGSRPFVFVLLIAAPLLGLASIAVSLVGQFTSVGMEFAGWLVVAGMGIVLIAALVDVSVRLAQRAARSQAVVA